MRIYWKQAVPVFVLGLILGAAAGSWAHRAAFRRFAKEGPGTERMLARQSRELKLDAGQQEAVRKVLESQHAQMKALHQETAAKFEELSASFKGEVKKALSPEQQAKFEAMTARWEAHRKRWSVRP